MSGVHWKDQRHLLTHKGAVQHNHEGRGSEGLLAQRRWQTSDCTGDRIYHSSAEKLDPIWNDCWGDDKHAGWAEQMHSEKCSSGSLNLEEADDADAMSLSMLTWEVNESTAMTDSDSKPQKLLSSPKWTPRVYSIINSEVCSSRCLDKYTNTELCSKEKNNK